MSSRFQSAVRAERRALPNMNRRLPVTARVTSFKKMYSLGDGYELLIIMVPA